MGFGATTTRRIDLLSISRIFVAAFFVVAGAMHLLRPEPYRAIVPDQLPYPEALVALSGIAEIAGGIGLLVPATRRAAGWGLVLLLVAVFPANVNMAINPETAGRDVPEWLLWARLPLQPALIGWVLVSSRPDRRQLDHGETT